MMSILNKTTIGAAFNRSSAIANHKRSEKVRIEIVNNLCVIAFFGWIIGNLLLKDFKNEFYSIVTIPLILSFLFPLYLNKVNKLKEARIMLILLVSVTLFILYMFYGSTRYYEILYLLLFILIFYLLDDFKIKVSITIAVLASWCVPFIYVSTHTFDYPKEESQTIVLIILIGVLLAIYLIVRKTQDQIIAITLRQDANVKQQQKNVELITFHNDLLSKKGNELAAKNEEIETFFSLSSEYLKNPTRELIILSESLQKNLESEDSSIVNELFSIINVSSKRMNELIEAVFEYSAISKSSPREKINANVILDEIIVDLHATIEAKSAIVTYDLLPNLIANKVELRMLFQNLISNAIKYSKPDVDPIVRVSSEDLGEFIKFSIKDNGIGIDKAHQTNIFNMFHKLHNQEEYAGSGIGLSHCKKIVNLHDGEIWVESQPGLGTTVFFTLFKKQS